MSNGLEHKDERLHAAQGADWRDKLADLRAELPGEDPAEGDVAQRGGEDGD